MSGVSLQRYTAYKDSGVEWLGKVPAHWEVRRLQDLCHINSKTLPETTSPDYVFNYVDISGVTYGVNGFVKEKVTFGTAPSRARRIVKTGDTIISTVRTYLKAITTIDKDASNLIVSTGFVVISPNKKIESKYTAYLAISEWFVNAICSASTGVSYPATNASAIGDLHFILPPLLEQTAIANYLDEKTAHIDRKIDLLSQKAARYAELKQTLINETVTRGLDQSVAMKDSGVEWIGQVPAHWEICRIDHIAKQQRIKNIGMREKNLLSLSYGKLKRKNIDSAFGLLPESFETYQIINPGNIILRLTDLQNDWTSLRVGLARERGIITSAYLCLCFTKQINPIFAYYLLHLYDLSKVFYWQGNGLRQTMKFDDIKLLPFAFPSYEEQTAIATYLDEKIAHIDRIITNIRAQIEQLQALRKVLINEVVTGKIRVCA